MMDKQVTIFTPTYNRAYILPQLYASLKKQTNKNFIWLVIDDGSTDDTEKTVQKWIEEKLVEIKYIKKENGGKHTAIELANQVCQTAYICCCDSDDFLSDDAVAVIYQYIAQYGDNPEIVGFVGRNVNYDGKPVSENWTKQSEKIWFYDLNKKFGYDCDTILIFKTQIIKKFHFPVFSDEKFVTESVFYQQFLYQYQVITIMECIHLAEYQTDGYTALGRDLFLKNPKGYLYALKQNAFCEIKHGTSFIKKLKLSTAYYVWQKVFKLGELAIPYKIKFPYNFLGNLIKLLVIGKYRHIYQDFIKRQNQK